MIEQHVKKISEGHRCVSLINSVDKKIFSQKLSSQMAWNFRKG